MAAGDPLVPNTPTAAAGPTQPPQPSPAAISPAGPVPNFAQTSAAALAPSFADASTTADNQKADMLDAIAKAGAGGMRQLQALGTQNSQDQQAALQAAIQRESVVQNMSPELAQQLGAQVQDPFRLNAQLLGAGEQAANEYSGLIGQAGSNYLTELKASLPAVEGDVQAKIAALQAAAYEKGPGGGKPTAATSLPAGAGNVQTLADELTRGLQTYTQQQMTSGTQPGVRPDVLARAYYDAVDKFNNKPNGWAQSIVNQGALKGENATLTAEGKQAALSNAEAKAIHDTTAPQDWANMVTVVNTLIKQGKSSADIFNALIKGGATTAQANAVISSYTTTEKGIQALGGG